MTTLAVEQYPDEFAGGVATCAPNGDFRKQINYWGDFRVVFDYFFPGVMPGTAVSEPNPSDTLWNNEILPSIYGAIAASPSKTKQLLKVTKAPIDLTDPQTSTGATVEGILWYSYFATQDGQDTLGGQPFDNRHKLYTGSSNDRLLNRLVDRFNASPAALKTIQAYYQTTGNLTVPLVTLHTTGDPIVPVWHQALYTAKVVQQHKLKELVPLTVVRYGHCNFTQTEAVASFYLMVLKSGGTIPLPNLQAEVQNRQSFKNLTGRELK